MKFLVDSFVVVFSFTVLWIGLSITLSILLDADSMIHSIFLPLVGATIFSYVLNLRFRHSRRKKSEERALVIESVKRHQPALSRNMHRALKLNDYGAVVKDGRHDAVLDFLRSIGLNPNKDEEKGIIDLVLSELATLEAKLARQDFDPTAIPDSGITFEYWVARELSKFGWNAEPTIATGDQGIDVIADKNGITVGIQCKLYSSSVGNKSVQEALAGKQHFRLEKAAVLSNANFTRSAKELAASTGIILMSQYDIPRADELFLE